MATATTTPTTTAVPVETVPFRYLDWGPVILGALGAAAMSVVLLAFGSALGLSVVSPYPYAGISAKGAAILAAVYLALVMVASFAAGGYIAGRMRSPWRTTDETESYFRDGAHGFGVWSIGVLLGAALAASGVGAVVSAAGKATTAIAAAGTAGAASNPAMGQLSLRPTDYAIDRLLAPGPMAAPADPAATAAPAGGTQVPAMQARRTRADLEAPMARALAASLTSPQLDVRDRTYLARVVAEQTGMSQADAEKRVDETYADLKAAEQKARDAADAARKTAIIAAFLAAATLAIGCAAACAGAGVGARHRDERTAVSFLGSTRFW
ncbi:hypothetical protein [Reyranella sp.]|jgi:hypothetical protein|uniref:hypothetical protein n=1 Tax=Reyranella sp. TaxID=1929291 RepID=UPI000BCCD1C4|nr:hypothetical protein [Reyranella sp.]OYY40442.1 MAG: hypothetical protein B7Y57_17180 [Rhodospirillales bacterium 35-66-84]OYZ93058.1 MAG: hypothetical protein B7Y08_18425 [Rhodospirillales bacterium 24-66-33]OZB24187.1 MAG: hypothetical protein B7X63_16390 [Rhodospirillales bacterium 39-66-50]HQS18781.1 hypothetical protein [Reyranella sp.]HQT14909.1 hypothetical protein [Reyranella sp.]